MYVIVFFDILLYTNYSLISLQITDVAHCTMLQQGVMQTVPTAYCTMKQT